MRPGGFRRFFHNVNGRTYGRTDGRTPLYCRDARTHLKKATTHKKCGKFPHLRVATSSIISANARYGTALYYSPALNCTELTSDVTDQIAESWGAFPGTAATVGELDPFQVVWVSRKFHPPLFWFLELKSLISMTVSSAHCHEEKLHSPKTRPYTRLPLSRAVGQGQ